jgi:hypothetical protein
MFLMVESVTGHLRSPTKPVWNEMANGIINVGLSVKFLPKAELEKVSEKILRYRSMREGSMEILE